MLHRSKWMALVACATALFTSQTRAEPLPPELNLVPRDAALFVSIRVADLWNEARIKPLRDFLVEEGRMLRELERDIGVRPEEVERVSVVCPTFHSRRVLSEPMIVLTFTKPYNLAKLLDSWGGMTEAEMQQKIEKAPIPNRGIGAPKAFPDLPPKAIEEKPVESKPNAREVSPLGKDEGFAYFQIADPTERPVKGKDRPRDLKAPYYILSRSGGFLIPINERTVVIGIAHDFGDGIGLHGLLAVLLKKSDKGPLTAALEAATTKDTVVLGLNLPSARDAIPDKSWINALPIDSILKCRSVTATLSFGEEIRLTLNVDGPDQTTAKRVLDVLRSIHILGMESLPGLKNIIDEDSPGRVLLTLVEPIIREAKFELKGTTVNIVMATRSDEQLAKSIKDTIEKLKIAAENARAQNNLKQLAIAIHNYHDANNRFPFQGVPGPNGVNPKLSWRVAILPYIEEGALYNQFKLDEAWDSDHNKKLIDKMPKLYAPMGSARVEAGQTFYRTFTGAQTISAANSFVAITDGTANTLMIVESGESGPWTKPEDLPYDPNKPLPKFGGHFKGKMHVAMGDGSVRSFDLTKVPESVLRALITANGGEVVSYPY